MSKDGGEVSLHSAIPPSQDIDTLSSSGSTNDIQFRSTSSRILHHLRRLAVPLALGQFLSAMIASTVIASNYLINFGVSLPLAQNLTHYTVLAIAYGIVSWHRLLCRPIESSLTRSSNLWYLLRTRGWQYCIVGIIDMHANWAIVSAYNYTNLTSVQLLDCLTIPTAMVLSRLCLKTRYKRIHVAGVIICLVGAVFMIVADYLSAKSSFTDSTTWVLLGDFLVVMGAIGYGASNVYQEYLVRKYGIIDYLSFSSLAATLCTAIYCASLESKTISDLLLTPSKPHLAATFGCLLGFSTAMFLLYTVLPFALSKTNAVLVNLSLMTADVYALLIGIYCFGHTFHPLYLISFGAIMLGVCLFASKDPIFRDVTKTASDNDIAEDNA